MNRTVLKSRVGPDGVLQLTVPFGSAEANREVTVTIDDAPPSTQMTQAEWREWVMRMSGSIDDPSFFRHDQGEFEQREKLQ